LIGENMVKSKDLVEEKMKERVQTAGKYLKAGMEEAEDPIDVLLSNPDLYLKRMIDGLMEALRTGKILAGLKRAKERDAWKNSIDRAASHYEERAEDMVKNAMESYEKRMECIEKARKAIADMPKATRKQKIARSQKYLEVVGECFDKVFGRKQ